jgi:predicted O-linked N-acetylglucosamine transferase (SPINDLY family)
VTLAGRHWATRVAVSLFGGLGEPTHTVAATLGEYEQAAVALATDPAATARLRAAMLRARSAVRQHVRVCAGEQLTCGAVQAGGLFDTSAFAAWMETALAMQSDLARSGGRGHVVVAQGRPAQTVV